MFNNRKYINQLTREIKNLKEENKKLKVVNKVRAYASDFWIEKYYGKNQENEYLRNKINTLEKLVKWHEENECELNTELCRSKGQLEKLRNVYKMQTGIDILEGEE